MSWTRSSCHVVVSTSLKAANDGKSCTRDSTKMWILDRRTLDRAGQLRGVCDGGKDGILGWLITNMGKTLAVEDASPTSAALMTLQRWMEKIVEKEVARITAKCQRYQERQGYVPRWVESGMGERFRRVEQIEQRVQMLLGIVSAKRGAATRVQARVLGWRSAHSALG
jgi:hypothetical protein